MGYIARLGAILMFIAGLAAGGLALLNNKTAPLIKEQKEKQQAEARREVVQSLGVQGFDKVEREGFEYYEAVDTTSGEVLGYTGLALGKGYSSTIETIAGFDKEMKVTGLKITFQQETPGLGTKSVEVRKGENEPWFLRQFKDHDALHLNVKQDRGDIDAITGATITSRAVTTSIRELATKIKADLDENAPAEDVVSVEGATEEGAE